MFRGALVTSIGSIGAKPSQYTKTQELDPKIWSTLPYDLILNTIEYLPRSDLVHWSCVNRALCPVASNIIWRQLRISFDDLAGYADERKVLQSHSMKKTVIQSLLEGGCGSNQKLILGFAGLRTPHVLNYIYQLKVVGTFGNVVELSAQISNTYVRELVVEQSRMKSRYDERQQALDLALARILRSSPGLIKCTLDEQDLEASTFHIVLQVRSLRSLDIRYYIRSSSLRWIGGLRKDLNLGLLSTLRCLQSLRIGCLSLNEARGLAEAISILNLETLELLCYKCRWDRDLKGKTTPLVRLIDYLLIGTAEGFPKTLKKLILSVPYHGLMPLLHQRIMTAVALRPDLVSMEITNRIDKDRCKHLGGQYLYQSRRRFVV